MLRTIWRFTLRKVSPLISSFRRRMGLNARYGLSAQDVTRFLDTIENFSLQKPNKLFLKLDLGTDWKPLIWPRDFLR